MTTHTDVAHLHNHFVINSVHYENGMKLRQNPGTLTKLRSLSDDICLEHGLSVLEAYKKTVQTFPAASTASRQRVTVGSSS